MADLMCSVSTDVAKSRMQVSIFNLKTDEVLFFKGSYHANFFNASSTRRVEAFLAEAAADWAESNGFISFAEEIREEYQV